MKFSIYTVIAVLAFSVYACSNPATVTGGASSRGVIVDSSGLSKTVLVGSLSGSINTNDDNYTILVADLNKDGAPDLIAVANPFTYDSGSVYFKLGSRYGTASSVWSQGQGLLDRNISYYYQVADISGDGLSDLVAIPKAGSSQTGWATVCIFAANQSQFNAAVKTGFLDADVDDQVYLSDINGDGKADLIAIPPPFRGNSGKVYVGLSDGLGHFGGWNGITGMLDADVKDAVYFADINGDGYNDLIGTPPPGRGNTGKVYVGLSNGGAKFTAWSGISTMPSGLGYDKLFFMKINNDNYVDLVRITAVNTNNSGNIDVGLGNSAGGFQTSPWSQSSHVLNNSIDDPVYFYDINNDGRMDAIVIPGPNRESGPGVSIAGHVFVSFGATNNGFASPIEIKIVPDSTNPSVFGSLDPSTPILFSNLSYDGQPYLINVIGGGELAFYRLSGTTLVRQ